LKSDKGNVYKMLTFPFQPTNDV